MLSFPILKSPLRFSDVEVAGEVGLNSLDTTMV